MILIRSRIVRLSTRWQSAWSSSLIYSSYCSEKNILLSDKTTKRPVQVLFWLLFQSQMYPNVLKTAQRSGRKHSHAVSFSAQLANIWAQSNCQIKRSMHCSKSSSEIWTCFAHAICFMIKSFTMFGIHGVVYACSLHFGSQNKLFCVSPNWYQLVSIICSSELNGAKYK